MLALTEIFKHDASKGSKLKNDFQFSNSLNLASDMLQDFILHKLEGGNNEAALEQVLGRIEPNGVLKIFAACLSTTKSADVLLVLLEQIKPTITYLLNKNILLSLFSNLLMLGHLTYEGL